jgi:hypothetical protein
MYHSKCGACADHLDCGFINNSGVTIWSKIDFVVDFRNLLFGCDFDLSFSKSYSLMKIFNYEVDLTAKCHT